MSRILETAVALGVLVGACGHHHKPRKQDGPAQPQCGCNRLDGPLEIPRHPSVIARWEAAHMGVEALFAELAPVFEPTDTFCLQTIDSSLEFIINKHTTAIDESLVLNAMTCDHFARWELERGHIELRERMKAVQLNMTACSNISDEVREQLTKLTTIRRCSSSVESLP